MSIITSFPGIATVMSFLHVLFSYIRIIFTFQSSVPVITGNNHSEFREIIFLFEYSIQSLHIFYHSFEHNAMRQNKRPASFLYFPYKFFHSDDSLNRQKSYTPILSPYYYKNHHRSNDKCRQNHRNPNLYLLIPFFFFIFCQGLF